MEEPKDGLSAVEFEDETTNVTYDSGGLERVRFYL